MNKVSRTIGIALGTAALGLAAGCSGASSSSSSQLAAPAATAAASTSAPASLTAAQGAQICNDINAWIPDADNQDMPRFSAQLQQDEAEAQGTQLGTDMSNMDSDLQTENSVALEPMPPGQPSDISALSADCQQYGVKLNWNG